jgi:hypothetical protein
MSCTAAGEGLVAGLAWGAAAEEDEAEAEADEGITGRRMRRRRISVSVEVRVVWLASESDDVSPRV